MLEILFIERFLETSKKRYIIGLILIPILLANTHAALFPIYFVIFLPYIAEHIISKIIKKRETSKIIIQNNNNAKWLIIIFFVCLLTGLLTPIKDIPYTYMIKSIQGNTMEFISEHQAVELINDLKLIIMFAVISTLLFLNTIKIKLCDLFMIIGMSVLAIISYKQFPIFLISTMCIINKLIVTLIYSIKEKRKNTENIQPEKSNIKGFIIEKLKKIPQKLLTIKAIIYIISIIIIIFLLMYRDIVTQEYVDKNEYPVLAANWINENVKCENIRLLNEFNYGSYLIFRDIPVFIDGRADVYDNQFNGKKDELFLRYMLSSSNIIWYEDIIKDYEITHIILKEDTSLNMIIARQQESYKTIYSDGTFVIYEVLLYNI